MNWFFYEMLEGLRKQYPAVYPAQAQEAEEEEREQTAGQIYTSWVKSVHCVADWSNEPMSAVWEMSNGTFHTYLSLLIEENKANERKHKNNVRVY